MRVVMCSLLAGVMALGTLVAAQSRQTFPGPMPNLPFSAAVKADGLIYVAGTLSAEGDIRAQTKKTIEDMSAVLQKAGSSLANVASVNVYLTKADDFAAMNEVYRTFWAKDPPVRTTIVSDLVIPGARRTGSSRPIHTATASALETRSSSPASSPATARTTPSSKAT